MKYSFYAPHTHRENFDEWRQINHVPTPNVLSIEQRYQKSPEEFGNPLHEERDTPDKSGRYQTFEHGSIHWYPLFGAYMTTGAIRNTWRDLGWENGWLGYPMTEEYPISEFGVNELTAVLWGEFEDSVPRDNPGGRDIRFAQAQQFYGGLIYWIRENNQCVVLKRSGRTCRGLPLFFAADTRTSSGLERWIPDFLKPIRDINPADIKF